MRISQIEMLPFLVKILRKCASIVALKMNILENRSNEVEDRIPRKSHTIRAKYKLTFQQ